jgi:hypothetical protein
MDKIERLKDSITTLREAEREKDAKWITESNADFKNTHTCPLYADNSCKINCIFFCPADIRAEHAISADCLLVKALDSYLVFLKKKKRKVATKK